jgi:DNA-binding CsgD family transcriptional regulator/tetratricopeptide (TPR) repeat protein
VEPVGALDLRGREQELSSLREAFESARSGRATAAFVNGSAGVGKTRLVGELTRHAGATGATVLTGSAVAITDAPPFGPFLAAMRSGARRVSDSEVSALLRSWLQRLGDADTGGRPVQLIDLLFQLVVDLAAVHPLVLVLEDLHWADRSTRDLLTYLVANLEDEPVLVVATLRTDSPAHPPEFLAGLAELRRLRHVLVVDLQPLPRAAIAALVGAWAPGDEPLEELVWQRSAGNVFIAEETVRAVLSGDARGLPNTLREIVLGRLALLSRPAQDVVRALAVGVGPLPHGLLATVSRLDPAVLPDALRETVAHGVVYVDGGATYGLRHGLLTEVVAGDLLPGERAELHSRFAEALARDGEPGTAELAAELAHHWYEAGEPERALHASTVAARMSESVYAHAEAYRLWMRAAELIDVVPRNPTAFGRADCLDRAARSAALAGDHDEAVALIDQLLTSAGTGLAAALLTARAGNSIAAAGRAGEAQQRYREATAHLPRSGAEAARAQVLAGYGGVLLQCLDFEGARVTALQALALAREVAADAVEARVLAVLAFGSAYLADAEGGVAAIDQALDVAERTGEPEVVGEAHVRRADLMTGPLNRLVEGIEQARRGVERMRELGLTRTAGVALLTLAANALFRLGRWDEAGRTVEEAWALGPTGTAGLDVRLARVRLQLGRGELQAAATELEVVELLARTAAGPRQRIPLLVLFAALELWRREPAAALRYVEDGLTVAEGGVDDIWSLAPLVWHGTRAWADVVASGVPAPASATGERLERHVEELARRATQCVPAVRVVIEAFTLMCAAEVARARRVLDEPAWARVAAAWEALEQPYPAAYARLRHAESLLSGRPRGAAAVDALRKADRAARALGAQPLLDEIADLAVRGRVELVETRPGPPAEPPSPRGPLDALTARELDVLTELAKGLTNREIAARLYISEKTVGVHVSRIFAKIGVHTRVQASAVLQRARPDDRA